GKRPYTQADALAVIKRAAGGQKLQIEWNGRRKDGTYFWHEVFVKSVTIGGQDRVLALARDITARRTAEEALRASEEQYHAMFKASIDGLALWNADGEIVDPNPALCRMYGYSDEEFSSLRHGVWAGPAYSKAFLQAVAAGQSLQEEI